MSSAQSIDDRYSKILEPFLQAALQNSQVPGLAIGIVENGRLVYARGFGVMQIGAPGKPITTKTLFHMASITKPFVATALMQLAEQSKVDLNATVVSYLPYFRLSDSRYKMIAVRQIVSHTSGMPDVEMTVPWNGTSEASRIRSFVGCGPESPRRRILSRQGRFARRLPITPTTGRTRRVPTCIPTWRTWPGG